MLCWSCFSHLVHDKNVENATAKIIQQITKQRDSRNGTTNAACTKQKENFLGKIISKLLTIKKIQ